jgi:hypothetical protein
MRFDNIKVLLKFSLAEGDHVDKVTQVVVFIAHPAMFKIHGVVSAEKIPEL